MNHAHRSWGIAVVTGKIDWPTASRSKFSDSTVQALPLMAKVAVM